MAVLGGDAFGVELHTMDGARFVRQSHDEAVFGFGRDGEAVGQRFPFDDQRMVAGRVKGRWQPGEDALPFMKDGGDFAVARFGRADNLPAKGLPHGLKPQADTEQGDIRRRTGGDEAEADAGMVRIGRAGGNDDSLWFQIERSLNTQRIVAVNDDILPQIPHILDEIVGERVIIIYQQDHGPQVTRPHGRKARNKGVRVRRAVCPLLTISR